MAPRTPSPTHDEAPGGTRARRGRPASPVRLAEAVARLGALGLPVGHYAVHASGVLLAHGLIDEAGDLDVVARGPAWERARTLGPARAGRCDRVIPVAPDIEVFDGWLGADVDALIAAATWVGGLPCVPLEEVLAFKERLNREKDRAHVALLRAHLGLRG